MNRVQETPAEAGPPLGPSPPRPPLAFRVGVVGHRPDRLGQADIPALERTVREVLTAVREGVHEVQAATSDVYADGGPVLRAISPLAEGTDRLLAEQALDLGFELCCVMPFSQGEFERDFTGDQSLERHSLERFRRLLSRAESATQLTRFELDGDRIDEGGAYAVCGRVVLNESDLLLVVWDGYAQGKRGGTEETFEDARRRGTPVVWIDACAPHRWQIIDAERPLPFVTPGARAAPDRDASAADFQWIVHSLLDLPQIEPLEAQGDAKKDHVVRRRLAEFYAERQAKWNPAAVWKMFQSIVGDSRWPRVSFRVADFESAVKGEWPDEPTSAIGRLVGRLRPYFAWPDQLAVLYSDRYRSAFILAYTLAAAAVGLALLPYGASLPEHSPAEKTCMALEFCAIMALVLTGRRRRWHERWLDYRLAAELVRHVRLVAPLGGGRSFPQVPAHWTTYGQPGATWMAWYVRAVERALGLPTAIVDQTHLRTCLAQLQDLVRLQIDYHERAAERCHRMEHRLHHWGIALLLLTLVACGLHVYFSEKSDEENYRAWLAPNVLTFICGVFPALGAAMAGISNQGEFRRIARRSEAMAKQLESLLGQIDLLGSQIEAVPTSAGPLSSQAAALAGDVARLLVNEILDWRVVFLDRPLDPPA